jgi:hypothetical protein
MDECAGMKEGRRVTNGYGSEMTDTLCTDAFWDFLHLYPPNDITLMFGFYVTLVFFAWISACE